MRVNDNCDDDVRNMISPVHPWEIFVVVPSRLTTVPHRQFFSCDNKTKKRNKSHQGFLSGPLAPPETILQRKTLPGSCWPMAGPNGHVTIQLAYPVVVDAVSVDHVSWDIVPDGQHMTAPKNVKVVGYPPCDDDDDDVDCKSLGFDMSDPIDVAQFVFDVESGEGVQTFESNYAKALNSLPKLDMQLGGGHDDDVDGGTEGHGQQRTDAFRVDHGPGSCSSASEATSCSSPPRVRVAGLTIHVLDNWGHPDFTCLYRVRIHGEKDP
jgi:SUN domain-containing protein 1/2